MATFLTIPRIWFGEGQKILFPLYFALSFVMSCMTMATYIQLHMGETMETKEVGIIMLNSTIKEYFFLGLGLWCLTPLSTTF